MKKLMLLMSILLVTLTSFSQTVIQDTIVSLKVPTAKLVIKDLIRGDAAKVEIIELNKIISLKDDQLNLFKQKDKLKDEKITNLDFIITKKDEQFSLERLKSESLLKELKTQRRKTFFFKLGSFVAVISTSILLLK